MRLRLLALGLTLVACHDDKTFDPTQAVAVDTLVDPGSVAAGTPAQVTCVRLNGHGERLDGGQFVVGIDPLAQSFVEGAAVSSTQAGMHAVTCSDGQSGLIDDSPAELMVVAGPAVETRIALTPAEIAAGDPSAVTCQALDAHGNVANAELSLVAEPAESVTATGVTSITAETAGSYEVTCAAVGIDVSKRGKATLTVVPGPRDGIALRFTPNLPVYATGQAILVEGVGQDRFGNVRPDDVVPVTNIDATPGGAHTLTGEGNNRIRFSLENRYTVSAAAFDDPEQTASAPLVVDQTKPVLTIKSPERGVVTDSMQTIKVAGNVSDNLGQIAYLKIGGQQMSLPLEGGEFSYDVPLQYGHTLMDIRAADTQGFETLVTRAAEQGLGGFRPLVEHTFEADGVDNAAAIVMTQALFDDGDHDEASLDDLASIIEHVIKNLDFKSLAPNPLATFSCVSGDCTLELTSVTMEDANVAMTLKNGAIGLDLELIDFNGTMTMWYPCDVAVVCPQRPRSPIPIVFHADRVNLVTDVLVSVVGNETTATASNTDVEIEGFTATTEGGGVVGGLAGIGIESLVALVHDYLVEFMEAFMTDLVEDQVDTALDGLFDALKLDTTFDIPAFVEGQAPNTLVIQTRPKGADIAPERLQLRVDALAYSQTTVRPHPHLGSIRHTGCSPERALTFPPPSPLTVALHDDFINELLFAIWDGGTLTLNISGAAADALLADFGMQGATIKVDALLPLVFESCDGQNKVQIGELNLDIETEFAGQHTHIGLWMLAEAPFDVTFAPNAEGVLEATLVLDHIDPLHLEVVANQGLFEADDEGVRALVRDTVIPKLLDTVSESAKFALPAINLGQLTGTGDGPTINLDLQSVARDNAYLTINGGLK